MMLAGNVWIHERSVNVKNWNNWDMKKFRRYWSWIQISSLQQITGLVFIYILVVPVRNYFFKAFFLILIFLSLRVFFKASHDSVAWEGLDTAREPSWDKFCWVTYRPTRQHIKGLGSRGKRDCAVSGFFGWLSVFLKNWFEDVVNLWLTFSDWC